MAKKKKQFKRRLDANEAPVPRNCPFDKSGVDPDYKDVEMLQKYLSDRAKIVGKARTGICAKHQRMISLAIKRARHLGLLPYTPRI